MTARRVLLACLISCKPTPEAATPVSGLQEPPGGGVVAGAGAGIDAAIPPDAAPVTADLQCYANGPKEFIRIQTNTWKMNGTLWRVTSGPAPERKINYRVVPDGPTSFDLVFVEYAPGDYLHEGGRKPKAPRESLTPGKSVIARVEVVGKESRIFSRDVDLHTGMDVQNSDHSYPCNFHLK